MDNRNTVIANVVSINITVQFTAKLIIITNCVVFLLQVMREVNRQWCLLHPPNSTLTTIPPLLMAMFHRAVRPLLDYHSGCGGVLVLRWSHRILHEVTESTYFSYRPTAQARYNTLASYFTGVGSASRSAGETGN